jgi:hypothetical protein
MIYFLLTVKVQSQNSERIYLWFDVHKPVFVKRDMGVYMIDLYREGPVNRFLTWILWPTV